MPTVTGAGGSPEQAVTEELWREETPHVLAALLRRSGDLGACEDAVQEALLAAAAQWPREGVPDNPRGWLVRVASRRMIDHLRSESARAERELRAHVLTPGATAAAGTDAATAADRDDTLMMLLLCCHPALTPPSQVALTLRAVGGLSTVQVAAGFLVPEATMAQRISRAKAALQRAGARFDEVPPDELPARLHAVRHALYLMFNEGHYGGSGNNGHHRHPGQVDLAGEAVRLAERLHRAAPEDDESTGLLALMLLTGARATARLTDSGDLVPLAEQDRRRWDRLAIRRGTALLERVLPRGSIGPFQLQAAVAAVHGNAATWQETDWLEICLLYRMLEERAPSPTVTLNLAIAIGMAHGPVAGLQHLGPLLEDPAQRNHRVLAAAAHLRELAGDLPAAANAYRAAASLTQSLPEQRYLNSRLARLTDRDTPRS